MLLVFVLQMVLLHTITDGAITCDDDAEEEDDDLRPAKNIGPDLTEWCW